MTSKPQARAHGAARHAVAALGVSFLPDDSTNGTGEPVPQSTPLAEEAREGAGGDPSPRTSLRRGKREPRAEAPARADRLSDSGSLPDATDGSPALRITLDLAGRVVARARAPGPGAPAQEKAPRAVGGRAGSHAGSDDGRARARKTGDRPARAYAYQRIASDLRGRILDGEFAHGHVLPTEVELGTAYVASRLTVRRALAILRGEGLLDSRRGFGWFVRARGYERNLTGLGPGTDSAGRAGDLSTRQTLNFGFEDADARVAEVLGVDRVLSVDRLDTSNGEVVSRSSAWVPEDLSATFTLEQVERASLADLLPVRIGEAEQRLSAIAASVEDAAMLRIPAGSPCIQSERITWSLEGRPVLYALSVFAGHRISLLVAAPRRSGSRATSP